MLLLLFFRLLVGSPDVLADERLAHHLHDGLRLRVPVEDAPGVAVILFLGLVADAKHLDVVEVKELLLGQLGAGVGGAAWSTPEISVESVTPVFHDFNLTKVILSEHVQPF